MTATNKTSARILQCAREIKPGGGVSGVAYNLEEQFRKLGIANDKFTINSLGIENGSTPSSTGLIGNKLTLLKDVLLFSILGTIRLRKSHAMSQDIVSICHNDVVWGDIYINHGLHLAMLKQAPSPIKMFLRNPLHWFLLIREWIRFNSSAHRKFVCFSEKDAKQLSDIYKKTTGKIEIIPNGVDIHTFKPDAEAGAKIRSELGLLRDNFVLTFIGHEFERKGLEFLIRALRLLPDNVILLVAGGGNCDSVRRYKDLAHDSAVHQRVNFLGTRSDIPQVLCASDLLVLPSSYETWALVGLEAMACEVPALMTKTGGITDYLKDGENGLFIERIPQDIASKVQRLLIDPQLLAQMRLAARQTALRYSWEWVAQRYIDLIQKVAIEKRQSA